MQLSNGARVRALVLLEAAKETPDPKDQSLQLAQIWLSLGVVDGALTLWMDQVKSETAVH
jgi:hypothetical protein